MSAHTNQRSARGRSYAPLTSSRSSAPVFRPSYTPSFDSTVPSNSLPPDRLIDEGLLPAPLQIIEKPPIDNNDPEVKIKNVELIGSYNWAKGSSATIIVPGSPPEWQNRPPPYTVPADTGIYFSDQNGFRMPSSTLLPLLIAVDMKAADPESDGFDWASVDFVTDRNGLRKLLRWIDGKADKDFRIDTQLAGDGTVLFNRWDKRTREEFNGRTYGFSFEKASTRPAQGCENSTGHHRIVTYDMNGLKMVVRFEVDACIPPTTTRARVGVDELADTLASIKISPSASDSPHHSTSHHSTSLKVIEGGTFIPQSSIIELTTRSEKWLSEFDWKESYPQQFLSQTPHHFLAVHKYGRFHTVQKRKLNSPDFQDVANEAQVGLKRLLRVLKSIKEIVVEGGQRGRLTLVFRDGELKVFARKSQNSCLPDEVMQRFDA